MTATASVSPSVRALDQADTLDQADNADSFSRRAECGICYEERPPIRLPCCGHAHGSSVRYCRQCIENVCSEFVGADRKKIGRCPTCRAYISCDDTGEIALVVGLDGERPKDLLSVLVWPSHRVAQAQAADEARWLEVSSSREMLRKLIVVFAIVGALGVLSVLLALHYCCGGFHASDADRRI